MKGGIPVSCGINWDEIKTEYITNSKSSYRKLAAQFNVNLRTIADRAKDEKWPDQKKQNRNKTVTDAIKKASDLQSDSLIKASRISNMLMSNMEKDTVNGTLDNDKAIFYRNAGKAVKELVQASGIEMNEKMSQAVYENTIADTELKRAKLNGGANMDDLTVNINFPDNISELIDSLKS